jgi:hypothetical protein
MSIYVVPGARETGKIGPSVFVRNAENGRVEGSNVAADNHRKMRRGDPKAVR